MKDFVSSIWLQLYFIVYYFRYMNGTVAFFTLFACDFLFLSYVYRYKSRYLHTQLLSKGQNTQPCTCSVIFCLQATSINYMTERWGDCRVLTRFYLGYIWLCTYHSKLEMISFVRNNTSGFTEYKTKGLSWWLHQKASLGNMVTNGRVAANFVMINSKIIFKTFTIIISIW